jgi:predicted RNA-binding protein YlqC (UPF0109 family)
MERDQQFLEYVVKALVDKPDDVKIDRTVDEMGVLLKLSVNRDDMGKVIGRSGATAKAIRTILRVVGMKNDARVNLKIEEPEGGSRVQGGQADMGDPDDVGTIEDLNNTERTAHIRQEKSLDDVLDSLK